MADQTLIHASFDATQAVVRFSANDLNSFELAPEISRQVGQLLADLAASGTTQVLQIDFSDIDRIGSIALNGLIGINSHARAHGMRITLVNVQPNVREIFALTRVERLFEFQTLASA